MQHRSLAFTMKFFADIRTKRHTAFVVSVMLPLLPLLPVLPMLLVWPVLPMLLVWPVLPMLLAWSFAFASSVTYACFLETHQPHARAVKKLVATTARAPAGLRTQSGTDAGHHSDSDGTKESCVKVRAHQTHTLPKTWAGIDHTDPGPAMLVATLWTGTPNGVSAPRRPDDAATAIVGPPLRVRYSRLAL